MNLQLEEQLKLTDIVKASGGDIQKAVLAAYEEGILVGGLRVAQRLGAAAVQATTPPSGSGDGDDDAPDSPLTASDRINLKSLGINPDQCFRQKNSAFKIVGYKPSRWKYPISTINRNGRRHKWPVDAIIRLQRAGPIPSF